MNLRLKKCDFKQKKRLNYSFGPLIDACVSQCDTF